MTLDACAAPERLAALRRYGVLDTPRERDFDRVVTLLACLCDAPIAVINLIEDQRQWFKAEVGLGIDGTPLDISICRHFLLQPGVTVIPDMTQDPRLAANPLIAGEPGLRFYAGCLLTSREEGWPLGTLCVLDHRARPEGLDATQRMALEVLTGEVMAQLELRLALHERQAALERQTLLLKEVHHRVHNSLMLVGSVVNLQMRGITDEVGRAALHDTARRIRSIAALHGQLHRAERLDSVELDRFLADLVTELQASAPPRVTLSLHAASRPVVSTATAVAVALLVNELVSNALKHAFTDDTDGRVEVTLADAAGGRLTLCVRDDGRGLPAGQAAPFRTGSLGMRLIAALAQQLRGELVFEDAMPGMRARLAFDAAIDAAPGPA